MIAEITAPPSEVRTLRWRYRRGIAAYCAGILGTTTIIGALAGAMGSVLGVATRPSRAWIIAVAIIALAYSLREIAIVRLPMPQIQWQVPARWSTHGKSVQGLLYGIFLGSEIFTFIPYASFYILVLIEATLGVRGGAVLGTLYGLARITPTLAGIAVSRSRRETGSVCKQIMAARFMFHGANGVALAFVSEVLIGTLLLINM